MSKFLFFLAASAALACGETTGVPSALASTPPAPPPNPPAGELQSDLRKAVEFQLLGEYDRAQSGYELVLKRAPETAGIRYQLAVCSFNLKDLGAAKNYAEESLRRHEVAADSANLLGAIAGNGGRKEEALAYFQKAAALNPKSDQYPFNASEALRELGRDKEAIPWLEKAVALKPQEPLYAFKLRMARVASGDLPPVQREVDEQLQLDHPTGDWLLLAAALCLQAKDTGRASTLMNEARDSMSQPIFFAMIQDPAFVAWRKDPKVDAFFHAEVIKVPADSQIHQQEHPNPSPAPSASPALSPYVF